MIPPQDGKQKYQPASILLEFFLLRHRLASCVLTGEECASLAGMETPPHTCLIH